MKILGQTKLLPVIEEVPVTRRYESIDQVEVGMDPVIVEHMLSILVDGKPCTILTCSPEQLVPLVVGHLFAQGFIKGIDWIDSVELSEDCSIASVLLTAGKKLLESSASNDWSGIEIVRPKGLYQDEIFNKDNIFAQATSLYESADWFFKTGAAHSSSLYMDGEMLYRFADVSRHNTIDKLIGQALLDGRDLSKTVLFTSGRIPLDMLTKVVRCGIPIVCSRSAPTTAALELAKQLGVTLIGFVRKGRMNVYT
jgi:FdhD protein